MSSMEIEAYRVNRVLEDIAQHENINLERVVWYAVGKLWHVTISTIDPQDQWRRLSRGAPTRKTEVDEVVLHRWVGANSVDGRGAIDSVHEEVSLYRVKSLGIHRRRVHHDVELPAVTAER